MAPGVTLSMSWLCSRSNAVNAGISTPGALEVAWDLPVQLGVARIGPWDAFGVVPGVEWAPESGMPDDPDS